jgi:hypothetical protein
MIGTIIRFMDDFLSGGQSAEKSDLRLDDERQRIDLLGDLLRSPGQTEFTPEILMRLL